MRGADAVIVSTPEYNGSVAGSMKNAIDWISRLRPVPFDRKPFLLLGATPGLLSAVRGLNATRQPLENLGAYVYPQVFGLARANEAFAEDGALKDVAAHERLAKLVGEYLKYAQKLSEH